MPAGTKTNWLLTQKGWQSVHDSLQSVKVIKQSTVWKQRNEGGSTVGCTTTAAAWIQLLQMDAVNKVHVFEL